MSIAQGSRSRIALATELTWGVPPVGTQGYQIVNVGGAKVGGSATGLANTTTVYSASIVVDGGAAQTIRIIGVEAQTYTTLMAKINNELVGASVSLVSGNLKVISNTYSVSSAIAITDTNIFSTLTGFIAVVTAVAGTGAAADATAIPYTSFSVNETKASHDDLSIQSDRMQRFSKHGNKQNSGELATHYSADNFDSLLESLMHNTWATNVLKTGTTRKSFLLEQQQLDITKYSRYTGITVNSMTLTVPVSGLVTAAFGLMGRDMSIETSPFDASVTDPQLSEPFFHAGGTFNEGGSSSGLLTSIVVTIDNGYNANYSLGDNKARDLSYGFAKVSGTIMAWFESEVMANKFLNETSSSVEFTLTDGVNSHTYLIPNVKYNSASKTISGNGPVTLSMTFVGLYDDSTSTNVRITRT